MPRRSARAAPGSSAWAEVHLRNAVAVDDPAQFFRLLQRIESGRQKLDLDGADDDGRTTLMLAASGGHAAFTEGLLRVGADPDSATPDGKTALVMATTAGHADCVRALIAGSADLECRTNFGNTACVLAAFHGRREELRSLLAAGARTDVQNVPHRRTALHYASMYGHSECVRLLLRHGAEAAALSSAGWTPAHGAAMHGHAGCLRLLLAADADAATALNHDGHSPLDLAVEQGHAECADLLRTPHEISETVLGMEAEDTSEVVVPRVEVTAEEEEGAEGAQADRDEKSAEAELQAEEGEPEEAPGPVHREASVDLPPRPPAVDGYQRVASPRPPRAPRGRPQSAPAVPSSRAATATAPRKEENLAIGLHRGVVLAAQQRRSQRGSDGAAPPSSLFVGRYRPSPPASAGQRRPSTAPASRGRPKRRPASARPASARPTTTLHERPIGLDYADDYNPDEVKGERKAHQIRMRRERVRMLGDWLENKHKIDRVLADKTRGEAGDDGSLGKGVELLSLLRREEAELQHYDEEQRAGAVRQARAESPSKVHVVDVESGRSTTRSATKHEKAIGAVAVDPPTRRQQEQDEDAPEARALNVIDKGELGDAESFLDPGAMVVCTTSAAGGPMWGRQTRVSRSSKGRYPYASVHDWCGDLGVSTYSKKLNAPRRKPSYPTARNTTRSHRHVFTPRNHREPKGEAGGKKEFVTRFSEGRVASASRERHRHQLAARAGF